MTGRGPNRKSPHDLTVGEFLDRLDSLPDDRLFSETHAGAMVGKSEKTLQEERRLYARACERDPAEAERLKSRLVPWIQVGRGSVRYRLGDLRLWIAGQRFGTASHATPEDAMLIPPDTGVGIMLSRLTDGLMPFAVRDGELMDFIDTADEEIDSVEMMLPEEASLFSDSGMRIERP